MGVSHDHRITNSASHHFYKILFLKNKQKKSLFRYVFFISQNIYCFKMTSNYSNDIFYFVEYVDLQTMRKVLNGLTLFSIFVLSYWNLAVYLNWMTDACVFVSVCWSVCAWVTEMTGCIANWIHPVLQVRKGRVPLLLKKRKSLPVIIWSSVSPLSSCIEPLFHCKEPLPIYSPQTFYVCNTGTTLIEHWESTTGVTSELWCLFPPVTNSPQVYQNQLFFFFFCQNRGDLDWNLNHQTILSLMHNLVKIFIIIFSKTFPITSTKLVKWQLQ